MKVLCFDSKDPPLMCKELNNSKGEESECCSLLNLIIIKI